MTLLRAYSILLLSRRESLNAKMLAIVLWHVPLKKFSYEPKLHKNLGLLYSTLLDWIDTKVRHTSWGDAIDMIGFYARHGFERQRTRYRHRTSGTTWKLSPISNKGLPWLAFKKHKAIYLNVNPIAAQNHYLSFLICASLCNVEYVFDTTYGTVQ